MKVIEVFWLVQPLYFLLQLLNPMSNVLAIPTLIVLNKIHELSGKILRYLESLPINDFGSRSKKKRWESSIDLLLRKLMNLICFPSILLAKFIRFCLLLITGTIHSLSGKTLNFLQQPSDENEKDVTDSRVNGWHPNLYFYLNRIRFQPSGEYIDEILLKWYGNYELLFSNPWYIEWLFPNNDVPSSQYASILTNYEAQQIKNNPEAMERVMTAFQLMLDFLGMQLLPNNQFKDSQNSHQRWEVLNNHAFLAGYITRILKMFKALNLHQLNSSWLAYLYDLIYKHKQLCNLKSVFINTWVEVLPREEKSIILSKRVTFY